MFLSKPKITVTCEIQQAKTGYNYRMRNRLIAVPSPLSHQTIWNTKEDQWSMSSQSEMLVAQFARNLFYSRYFGKRPSTSPDVEWSLTEIVFEQHTIRHILDGLNVNETARPVGIPPLLLKNYAPELTPFQCRLLSHPCATEFLQKYGKTLGYNELLKRD